MKKIRIKGITLIVVELIYLIGCEVIGFSNLGYIFLGFILLGILGFLLKQRLPKNSLANYIGWAIMVSSILNTIGIIVIMVVFFNELTTR